MSDHKLTTMWPTTASPERNCKDHIAIAQASKNEILADLYKSVSKHLKKEFLKLYPDTKVFQETYIIHEQLLKNIIAKDPKKTWNTVSKIIGNTN